jgi:hypothetical protein
LRGWLCSNPREHESLQQINRIKISFDLKPTKGFSQVLMPNIPRALDEQFRHDLIYGEKHRFQQQETYSNNNLMSYVFHKNYKVRHHLCRLAIASRTGPAVLQLLVEYARCAT